jgi:3-isopropylmalate/(R)-2-methylmalate dehydratase large subunit
VNIVEKILMRASGKSNLKTGEIIEVIPDLVMNHDGDNIYNIQAFKNQFKANFIVNRDKIVMGLDHNVPSNSINTAKIHSEMRKFAKEQNITFYDYEGVIHQLMIENHVQPYQLIFAADSHTCSYGALGALGIAIGTTDNAYIWATGKTWINVPEVFFIELKGSLPRGVYVKDLILKILGELKSNGLVGKVLQFCGVATYKLDLSQKITLCNMASEGGAFSAIIDPEKSCITNSNRSYDLGTIEPQIAIPHHVDNVRPLKELTGVKIDQVFLGSCTNGRFEDLAIAAEILKGRKVKKGLRLFVSPASRSQLQKIVTYGYLEILLNSGAILLNPGCSLCFGSCQGLMDDEESLLTTGNRNYRGRVGTNNSLIYIGSPATAAATAITGEITDPRHFV